MHCNFLKLKYHLNRKLSFIFRSQPFQPDDAIYYFFFRAWSKQDLRFCPGIVPITVSRVQIEINIEKKTHVDRYPIFRFRIKLICRWKFILKVYVRYGNILLSPTCKMNNVTICNIIRLTCDLSMSTCDIIMLAYNKNYVDMPDHRVNMRLKFCCKLI